MLLERSAMRVGSVRRCVAISRTVASPEGEAADVGEERARRRPPAAGGSRSRPPRAGTGTRCRGRASAGISRRKNEDDDEGRQDAGARQQHEVRAEHSGDRARTRRRSGCSRRRRSRNGSVTTVCERGRRRARPRGTRRGSAPGPNASSTLLPKIQRKSMFPPMWIQLPCMNIEREHAHRTRAAWCTRTPARRRARQRARVVAVAEDVGCRPACRSPPRSRRARSQRSARP